LVSLAYLHSVLQERRSFIPIGWSQFFEFTQADLNAASQIIEQRNDSMDVIKGLLQTTVYGSRMDSLFDRRVLNLFIEKNFPCKKFPLFDLPSELSLSSVSSLLGKCSLEDGPSLIGLSPNANATLSRFLMNSTFKHLTVLSSISETESSSSSPVSQIITSLCAQYPSVSEDVTIQLHDNPALDFISMQRFTAHKLLKDVISDSDSLSSADASLLPMHLRSISNALSKGLVPNEWQCDWIDCDSVEEWLELAFSRTASLDALAMRVHDYSVLTTQPIPLYSTMCPRAFISALMQTVVRMKGNEMNDLKIIATFDQPHPQALMSIFISDLVLQAAIVRSCIVSESKSPHNDLFKLNKCFLNICTKEVVLSQSIILPILFTLLSNFSNSEGSFFSLPLLLFSLFFLFSFFSFSMFISFFILLFLSFL